MTNLFISIIVALALIAGIAVYLACMYRNRHKRLLDILNTLCNIEESARDCSEQASKEKGLPAIFVKNTLYESSEIMKGVTGCIQAISKRWWNLGQLEYNVALLNKRLEKVHKDIIGYTSYMQQKARHEQDSRP